MAAPSNREQLLDAIAQLPDTAIDTALTLIQTLQTQHQQPPSPLPPQTAWQRMGGGPKFLIHNGQLSDRDNRRKILSDRINQRYKKQSEEKN